MLYLSDTRTVNIKSHKDVYVSYPQKGVVRFRGNNNDGKSVIPDVLKEVIGCTLHNKRRRLPLINYGVDEGYVTLRRSDGAILHVTINKEASKTFYRLQLPGREVITRYLADKGLRELVTLFGFHWDEKREMSLNLYNTYSPLLFINTPESYNYDVLTSVITDPVAEQAKEQLELVKKQFDAGLKSIQSRVFEKETIISNMKFWDEEALGAKALKLRELARSVSNLTTHLVPDLKFIPDISVAENMSTEESWRLINSFKPLSVSRVKDLELLGNIKQISCARKAFMDYESYRDSYENGKCFACGRGYRRGRKSCTHNTGHALA